MYNAIELIVWKSTLLTFIRFANAHVFLHVDEEDELETAPLPTPVDHPDAEERFNSVTHVNLKQY